MTEFQKTKEYDLEDRTFRFAQRCREFTRKLPRSIENREDSEQLVKASGSVAGNYIEANEAISPKDFIHRIKICRKEAKESRLWLGLVFTNDDEFLEKERKILLQESVELTRIFGSIIEKCKSK